MSDVRFRALLSVFVAALAVTGCGGGEEGATEGAERLVVMTDVAPVAEAFGEDRGRPRLLLLLSPT